VSAEEPVALAVAMPATGRASGRPRLSLNRGRPSSEITGMEDPRRRAIERLPRWGAGLLGGGLALAAASGGELRSAGLGAAMLGGSALAARLFVQADTVQESSQREQAEAWVRWTLGAGEWQRYLDAQRERTGREGRQGAAIFVGLGLVVALLMPPLGATVLQAILAFAGVSIVGLLSSFAAASIFRRQVERLRTAPPEVVLGPGFARVGTHELRWHRRAPWLTGGWTLASAAFREGAPAVLELELRWRSQGFRGLFPRVRPQLPVPGERLDDARALLAPGGPLSGLA